MRAEAYRRCVLNGEAKPAVAEDIGVNKTTLYRWLRDPDAMRAAFEREGARQEAEAARAPRSVVKPAKPKKGPQYPKRRGPKSKIIEPEIRETMIKALREGVPLTIAAGAAGIAVATWRDWEKKAAQGFEPYASYLAELRVEQCRAIVDIVKDIRSGRPGVQSLQWLLERVRHEDFGRRSEVTVKSDAPLSELSDDELAELRALAVAAEVAEP